MSNRSEIFGRLLKGAINSIATYEGKTAPIIEEELAEVEEPNYAGRGRPPTLKQAQQDWQ